MMVFVLKRVGKKTFGKGTNVAYQHFLLFPRGLKKKPTTLGSIQLGIVWYRVPQEMLRHPSCSVSVSKKCTLIIYRISKIVIIFHGIGV